MGTLGRAIGDEGGDAIVLVEGCRVPLVLRQVERACWRLVGDCFMPGAMYGERWDEGLCADIVLAES